MTNKTMTQATSILSIMFLIGTSCQDNSGLKSQLAAAQTQMAAQAQISQQQLTNAHDQTKLACYANATDVNGKALCDKL